MADPSAVSFLLYIGQPVPGEKTPISNRKDTIYSTIISFQVLAWVAGIFRLYVRLKVVNRPGWDDLLVLLCLLTTTWGLTTICLATEFGLGRHFGTLSFDSMQKYGICYYLAFLSYTFSTTFIKLSLLFQYLRIFSSGYQRKVCMGLIVLISLWGIAYMVMAIFPCWPISGFWNWYKPAKCYGFGSKDAHAFATSYISHAALNMVFDIAVLLAPLSLLMKPSFNRKQIMGLLAVFTLGSVVIVISIIRFVTITKTRAGTYPKFDPTWYGPISIILSCLEVEIAVIAASIPIFWPVLLELGFGKILVVQEVKVQAEERIELHGSKRSPASRASLSGSETELNRERSGSAGTDYADRHYKDQYIIDQVLPIPELKTHEVTVGRGEISHEYAEALHR